MDFVLITTDTHATDTHAMLDKRIIEQSTQTNTNSNNEHYAVIIIMDESQYSIAVLNYESIPLLFVLFLSWYDLFHIPDAILC